MEKQFIRVSELTKVLGLGRRTIVNLIREGKIPHWRPTDKGEERTGKEMYLVPIAWVKALATKVVENAEATLEKWEATASTANHNQTPMVARKSKPAVTHLKRRGGDIDLQALPRPLHGVLAAHGYSNWNEFTHLTPMQVRGITGIGDNYFRLIKRELSKRGLSLRNGREFHPVKKQHLLRNLEVARRVLAEKRSIRKKLYGAAIDATGGRR